MKTKRTTKLATVQLDDVERVFVEALALDPGDRARYFEALAKSEPRLAAEARSLVAAHEKAGTFLDKAVGPRLAAALEQTNLDIPEGTELGDFKILKRIGRGGFAHVYLARQISLQRDVALKVSADIGAEGKLMGNLEHDHIVKVFSEWVDADRGVRCMAMQYVPGISLERLRKELESKADRRRLGKLILDILDGLGDAPTFLHPASLQFRETLAGLDFTETVLWLGAKLAETLNYAHRRGVLHLDVKPGNILVNAYGRFLLSDFNVSLQFGKEGDEMPENFGGTSRYMAPEHSAAFASRRAEDVARIDARADVYALGLVLKELFELGARAGEAVEIPITIQAVLDKCLQRCADQRFPDGAAMALALKAALELYRINRQLPKVNWLSQFSFSHPLRALVVYGLVPQILASVVNILYNQIEIVSRLSATQQAHFRRVMLYYNPVVYGVCLALWVWVLWEIVPNLRPGAIDPEKQAPLRRRLLRLPHWASFITTVGWLPSSLLFPLILHFGAGPLSFAVFGHFFVSFVFSWLVALAYSSLFIQFVCVRVLYPRYWKLEENVRETAKGELRTLERSIGLYHFLTSYVPLTGSVLLLLAYGYSGDASHVRAFTSLASFLVLLGMIGSYLGSRRNNQLLQTVRAFAGEATQRRLGDTAT